MFQIQVPSQISAKTTNVEFTSTKTLILDLRYRKGTPSSNEPCRWSWKMDARTYTNTKSTRILTFSDA